MKYEGQIKKTPEYIRENKSGSRYRRTLKKARVRAERRLGRVEARRG